MINKFFIFLFSTLIFFSNLTNCYVNSDKDKKEVENVISSSSQEEIQKLIDSSNDGDIVRVPEGTLYLTDRLTIDKQITIIGAGIDKTIISRKGKGEILYINISGGRPFRISGITFMSNNETLGITVQGGAKNFRIDNNKFEKCRSGIYVWGYAYGVIDHNVFEDILIEGVVVYGDDTEGWDRESVYKSTYGDSLGHKEFVFIEDNDFLYTGNEPSDYLAHCVASNHGARYVFRYNNVKAPFINGFFHLPSPVDVHGNYSYGRGTVAFEVYNNVIDSEHSYRGMNIRGGTGVIYNNIFKGDFEFPVHLTNYRSWQTHTKDPIGGGGCPITITIGETVTNYDPEYCPEDYPNIIDMINNLYIWDNTYNESEVHAEVDNRGYNTVHIQENRDYFHKQRPGYTSYTYPHPLISN